MWIMNSFDILDRYAPKKDEIFLFLYILGNIIGSHHISGWKKNVFVLLSDVKMGLIWPWIRIVRVNGKENDSLYLAYIQKCFGAA